MPELRFTLCKGERLCNKKIISQLFEKEGTLKVAEYPFLLVWKISEITAPYPAQVVFIISRKKVKKAVQRNHIRRQMRELYRINKHKFYQLLEEKKQKFAIMICYSGPEKMEFAVLSSKFNNLIEKFVQNIG
jgi:ribonuclease P protein component